MRRLHRPYYKALSNFKFELKVVLSLSLDFFELFLTLFSVSSFLAALVNLGVPEQKLI